MPDTSHDNGRPVLMDMLQEAVASGTLSEEEAYALQSANGVDPLEAKRVERNAQKRKRYREAKQSKEEEDRLAFERMDENMAAAIAELAGDDMQLLDESGCHRQQASHCRHPCKS